MQRYDSCIVADDPAQVSYESSLLMDNLIVFSRDCHGGQQESWGCYRGISHEEILDPGTRGRCVILPRSP